MKGVGLLLGIVARILAYCLVGRLERRTSFALMVNENHLHVTIDEATFDAPLHRKSLEE